MLCTDSRSAGFSETRVASGSDVRADEFAYLAGKERCKIAETTGYHRFCDH